MSTRLVTVTADAPLTEAAATMRAKKVRRLLVTDRPGRLRVRAEATNPQAPRCRKEGSCSSGPSETS